MLYQPVGWTFSASWAPLKGCGHMIINKETPCVSELMIGDTLYIVEAIAGEKAKEDACSKVKRLIMAHMNDCEKLSEKTQISA